MKYWSLLGWDIQLGECGYLYYHPVVPGQTPMRGFREEYYLLMKSCNAAALFRTDMYKPKRRLWKIIQHQSTVHFRQFTPSYGIKNRVVLAMPTLVDDCYGQDHFNDQ